MEHLQPPNRKTRRLGICIDIRELRLLTLALVSLCVHTPSDELRESAERAMKDLETLWDKHAE